MIDVVSARRFEQIRVVHNPSAVVHMRPSSTQCHSVWSTHCPHRILLRIITSLLMFQLRYLILLLETRRVLFGQPYSPRPWLTWPTGILFVTY